MDFPFIQIENIGTLKNLFGWDNALNSHQNISLLGEKFLIHTLQNNGFAFDFTIAKQDKGKPYFKNNPFLHFSISNTQNHIAIVLHSSQVGIDIEYLRLGKSELAQKKFHPCEATYLNALENKTFGEYISQNSETNSSIPQNIRTLFAKEQIFDIAFTQLWTIKESYVKMTGTGIANNFSTIDLTPPTFAINQNYTQNNHKIISTFDAKSNLFVTITIK